jgi:integrase
MATALAASSIRDYANIVKAIIASAIDENGEQIFPRTWNEEFIDAPMVKNQHQPSTTAEGTKKILGAPNGQYCMLYALLAGCGPLRAGEALGLEIAKHISSDFRTLHIMQKAKRGVIQPYLKTKAGEREVDFCSSLAEMLREFIGDRREGLLFQTSAGGQLLQANTLQDSLHPIRAKFDHMKGGFNIFRRFRLTHVSKSDCPEPPRHFWSGHAPGTSASGTSSSVPIARFDWNGWKKLGCDSIYHVQLGN